MIKRNCNCARPVRAKSNRLVCLECGCRVNGYVKDEPARFIPRHEFMMDIPLRRAIYPEITTMKEFVPEKEPTPIKLMEGLHYKSMILRVPILKEPLA